MADYQLTKEFLARVFPWGVDGTGYLNLHWTSANFKGQAGRACASLDEAINTLQWLATLADVRDVYFCTSAQGDYDHAKTKKPTSRVALRASSNAIRFRAICVDLDAKGADDNSYNDLTDAVTALGKFVVTAGLPKPNVLVKSGGGLHVYWLAAEDMDFPTWSRLAHAMAEATRQHGLRCDTQCTVDSVRILRVPGTFNRKLETPRPVEALRPMRDPYALETLENALAPYFGTVTLPPSRSIGLGPAASALSTINAELTAGIDNRSVPPLTKPQVVEVMKGCAFLRGTFATKGRDHQNPLWHQSVLMSAFMVDGRKLAHAFSSGHKNYTIEETDREFDRVERDITDRGLGWPSCRAIAGAGCGDCAACPHFPKGKSPLHLALALPPPPPPGQPPVTPPGSGGTPTPAMPPNWDLPAGYSRNADGYVFAQLTAQDGSTFDKAVALQPLFDPWLQGNPRQLHFTTREKDGEHEVTAPVGELYSLEGLKLLSDQGVQHMPRDAGLLRDFLVAWISHLQDQKNKVNTSGAFGWEEDGKGGMAGFAYGGVLHKTDGSTALHIVSDATIDQLYRPTGDGQIWKDACEKLVTSQGTPTLEIIVAAAFAAPLVNITGYPGLVLSGFSQASGIGKTTASAVGQAVWASPLRTQTALDDTANSIFNKMGLLRSLPLYWDENRGAGADARKFLQILFQVTQGKERSRLKRNATQQVARTWKTLVVSTSNDPLADQIDRSALTTEAGAVRLFELEMMRRSGQGPVTEVSDSERMKARLDTNYGHAGAAYAAFLGQNYQQIYDDVGAKSREIASRVSMRDHERLWIATIVCILKGAEYANRIGLTNFHVDQIEKLMLSRLIELRADLNANTSRLDDPNTLVALLTRFMAEQQRHTIYTDDVRQRGGVAGGVVRNLRPQQPVDGVHVHIARDPELMRVSADALNEWLGHRQISHRLFSKALEQHLGMLRAKTHLAGGTPFATGRATVYELPMNPHLMTLLEGFE